jgi:hypothetical protein
MIFVYKNWSVYVQNKYGYMRAIARLCILVMLLDNL